MKHFLQLWGKIIITVAVTVIIPAVCQAQADLPFIIDPLPLADPLLISVATDKAEYVPGELLMIDVTAHNPNDYEAHLGFSSGHQAHYTMDDVYAWPLWGIAMFTNVSIPAQSSHTWSYRHYWSQYDLSIGTHSVVGTVVNVGNSQPSSFEVIAPTLPDASFLIDFEHLPDGRELPTMGGFADEYAAWGVHFGKIKSNGIGDIAIHANGDNQYAEVSSTSYPPGFNIIAQFDMPVYGVSAEVTSAEGSIVTMVAKDSNGQIIDSVVSDAISTVGEFVGSIQLQSQTPIASVEWWPSEQNFSVSVDNIYLTIPEPATLAMLAIGSAAMLRRKNGENRIVI